MSEEKSKYMLTRKDTGKKEMLWVHNIITGKRTTFTESEAASKCKKLSEMLNTEVTYEKIEEDL